jgi:hypothetical protein
MKVDTLGSPDMLATIYQTTKCNILEHKNPYRHSCGNLKSHKEMLIIFSHYEDVMHHQHAPRDQAFLFTWVFSIMQHTAKGHESKNDKVPCDSSIS